MITLRTVLAFAGMSAALTLAASKSKECATCVPAPTAAVPPECAAYQVAVDKLTTCASLPPASCDATKQRFEATATSWAATPADGRTALAATCKNATEAMKASGEACSH